VITTSETTKSGKICYCPDWGSWAF